MTDVTASDEPSDDEINVLDDDDPGISNWELFKKTWPLIRGPWAKARAIGKLLVRALP